MERVTEKITNMETNEVLAYRLKTRRDEIKAWKKLGEYEDLEEQGLLLRLPVAIGSDVFFIPSKANFGLNVLHHYEKFNRVYHQKVARINFTENGWYVEGNMYLEYGVTDRLFVDKLYKETWFTTKEEAEAALEKIRAMKGERDV